MIRKIKENKKILIIIAIISYIIISNIVIVKYLRNLERCFNTKILYGNENNIFEFIKLVYYNKIIWLICIIIASILSFFVLDVIYVRKRMKIENDGVKLKSKDGTHGTANFMDVREIEELQIGDEENTPGIVLGKTLDTDEIIVLPDTYKDINRNVMIWGASGSGKSTSYIIPNTLKIIDQENKEDRLKELSLKGKNVICTDPKGELYALTSKTFKDNGYDVKVFNLVSPKHSDGIDLIKLIENEKDAQEFAQIVISTSQNAGKSGDEFWQNEQQNLLIALLLHIRFEVEDKNKQNMRYLMSILASGNIKTVDEVFKYSKGITRNSYKVYAQGTDSIKQSTITGLATKLQIFQLNDIAAITEKDDINFYELNDKKMIIYCITSDMDTSMSFLNSIFFSFLFIKAVRQADSNKTQGLNRELCLFLDEFPNIGQIPDFSAKLSTIRSRAISTVIVCQHVAGIKNLYPNDIWQGLVGNTDIKIIMGTNDMLTARICFRDVRSCNCRNK